jgi:ERCC4-type nuclease
MFNSEYTDKQIKEIIDSIVILIDSREKVNSHIKMWLKSKKIPFEILKLDFGDYSFYIPKNDKLGIFEDIYFNNELAIERKANAEEISGNFTEERERFEREFTRGCGKIRLLIEDSSYSNICDGEYGTKLNPQSFTGSLHSFQEKYNTPFFFIDKQYSGIYIYNTFKYYLRNQLNKHRKQIKINT